LNSLYTFLRESTWGYPIIGGLHVLFMAWFGATVLIPELRRLRRIGIALMVASGILLFWLHADRYAASHFFRLKIFLLFALIWTKPSTRLALLLWAAVIFASRGIAFW
jgi:hypothetical protein